MTARIFKEQTLGVASDASFQEKVSRSLSACGVLQEVEKQLGELGWEASDASLFTKDPARRPQPGRLRHAGLKIEDG